MRAKMRIQIGGYRDGEPWPQRGGIVDLPDVEAERLFAAGYADRVEDDETKESDAEPTPGSDEAPAETGQPAADGNDGSPPARGRRKR